MLYIKYYFCRGLFKLFLLYTRDLCFSHFTNKFFMKIMDKYVVYCLPNTKALKSCTDKSFIR